MARPHADRRRGRRREKKKNCGALRGAIYARFSTRFQHSIDDQVRVCQEYADRHQIRVSPDYIFADEAERGCKTRRDGLQRLHRAISEGDVDVVLIMATNRLYRKTYKSLQFVEEEIVERGLRCVFVSQDIDTGDESTWHTPLQVHALLDEHVGRMNVAHIVAANRGLARSGMVNSTIAYGYRGEVVDGLAARRGRPRRKYAIDPESSPWVQRIFRWFVRDGVSIGAIRRRLTKQGAPLPPHNRSRRWVHRTVVNLLKNPRYRGRWEYGRKKSTWLSKKDYCLQVPREQPLESMQFESLRLVSDEERFAAQALLEQNRTRCRPRFEQVGVPERPRLLDGLLRCREHDRALYVGASRGHYYYCVACRESVEPVVSSMVQRQLATTLICRAIASAIRDDDSLVESIIAHSRKSAEIAQRPDPNRIQRLRTRVEALERQIGFVLEAGGRSEEDNRENLERLRTLRAERAGLRADLARLEGARDCTVSIPSEAEARSLLADLESLILSAANSADEEENTAARKTLEIMTGGVIWVVQRGERRRHRGWTRGMFRCKILAVAMIRAGASPPERDEQGPMIEIDFRKTTRADTLAEQAKELRDDGLPFLEIGRRLGCLKYIARKAVQGWYRARGQDAPRRRSPGRPPCSK